jgi:serine/threonine protein kinase
MEQMNEIDTSYLNNVKNRFLTLPRNAVKKLEHEANITDFNIIKKIGKGSFGKIYLVEHKKTKVKYALKAINKLTKKNQKNKKAIKREVEIMYKLDHPNIIKLYSHFEDNEYCYLLIQYISNGEAYDLIQENGKKPNLKLIASIIRDIIRAIYYLHNMEPKILHRDIKPENILIDEKYNAYLIDFGCANYIRNYFRRSSICGTPEYFPPEMISDNGYNESVDIWSIGVLLFELSTGKMPFEGDDVRTIVNNIEKLNIIWPSNIDPDIKDLCLKILRIDPNQRLTLEEIYEHNFFKKYLEGEKDEKKVIKPTKIKNKILMINEDISTDKNSEKNNIIENNDKKDNNNNSIIITPKKKDIIPKIDKINIKTKLINEIDSEQIIRNNQHDMIDNLYNNIDKNDHKNTKLSLPKNLIRNNQVINNKRNNHILKISNCPSINKNQNEEKKSSNKEYSLGTHRNKKHNNNTALNYDNIYNNNTYFNINKNKENINKESNDVNEKINYIQINTKKNNHQVYTIIDITNNVKNDHRVYNTLKNKNNHVNVICMKEN